MYLHIQRGEQVFETLIILQVFPTYEAHQAMFLVGFRYTSTLSKSKKHCMIFKQLICVNLRQSALSRLDTSAYSAFVL